MSIKFKFLLRRLSTFSYIVIVFLACFLIFNNTFLAYFTFYMFVLKWPDFLFTIVDKFEGGWGLWFRSLLLLLCPYFASGCLFTFSLLYVGFFFEWLLFCSFLLWMFLSRSEPNQLAFHAFLLVSCLSFRAFLVLLHYLSFSGTLARWLRGYQVLYSSLYPFHLTKYSVFSELF